MLKFRKISKMQRIIFLLAAFVCYSCSCDEKTYYLSEGEIALFPYENTNSITFIDNNQNFVVFENIIYERDIYEDNNPSVTFYSGPNCDDSSEEIQVSMSSSSDYDLFVGTDSGFRATIVDNNIGSFGSYYELRESEYINNYSFNDVIYDDVLRLYSEFDNSEIFLIKNIGVVEIHFGSQEFMLNS